MLFHAKSKNLSLLLWISGFALSVLMAMAVIPSHKTYAARTTTANVCERNVEIVGNGTLPNGNKYVSFEYELKGNDNARYFDDGAGNIIAEPGYLVDSINGNCTDAGLSGLFWNGSNVDLRNIYYQSVYNNYFPNYTDVKDVYWGGPVGSNYRVSDDYCTNPNIGWADAGYGWRGVLGIENCRIFTLPFAVVNDAGFAQINGNTVWCVGFNAGFYAGNPTCRGVNSATVYPGGGDFAGYQNITNGNALNNVAAPFRNYIQTQSPMTPSTGTSFGLRLGGFNTRDAVPPWLDSDPNKCANWPPGQPWPVVYCDWAGRDFGDPLTNIKSGIILTVELRPTAAVTNQTALGSCQSNTIDGWAYDTSNTSIAISVRLEINGTTIGTYPANRLSPAVNNGSGVSGPHGFSVDISSYTNIRRNYKLYTVGINAGGVPDGSGGIFYDQDIGPCNAPACGNLTTNPAEPEPNQTFSIEMSAESQQIAPAGGIPFRVDIISSSPALVSGVLGNGTIPANARFGPITPVTINGGRPIGIYRITYRVVFTSTGQTTANCDREIIVAAKPFFSVNNGDIASGFNGTCPSGSGWTTNAGRLAGWNNAANQGAGTSLAVLALSTINDVASSRGGTGAPNRLSFANTSGGYGGNFGSNLYCPSDYYGQNVYATNLTGAIPGGSGDYKINGPYTLGSQVFNGKVALYVNGDAYISGDISVANPQSSFYLVVRGNIFIAPGVNTISGVYIAQGSGSGGQIYTCANGFAPPTAAMMSASPNNGCNRQLTVNGAFVANKVNLYRTFGTLSSAQSAEVFNYIPNVWISAPASIARLFSSSGTTSSPGSYDAITSLPPVL